MNNIKKNFKSTLKIYTKIYYINNNKNFTAWLQVNFPFVRKDIAHYRERYGTVLF